MEPYKTVEKTGKNTVCPGCNATIPMDAAVCPQCHPRIDLNVTASMLNIIPGLGHIYKGHVWTGIFLLFLGMPLAMSFGLILLMPTVGLSLLLPLFFWVWAIVEVYLTEDYPQFRHKYLHL